MNTKAVADGLAARFTGLSATLGSETETLAMATASLPNQVGAGPALLVFHPKGILDVGVSKLRRDELDYPIRFLRDPSDYPTRSDWLYAWTDVLRDRIEMNIDLDLVYVAWARPIDITVDLDGATYAGVGFDLIEMTARVHFNETVSTLAI